MPRPALKWLSFASVVFLVIIVLGTATGAKRRKEKCYGNSTLRQRTWIKRLLPLNVPLSGAKTLEAHCDKQCERGDTTSTVDVDECRQWCDFAFTQYFDRDALSVLNDYAFPPDAAGSLKFLVLLRDPVERFISEFFFCTKTDFGRKACLSDPLLSYTGHNYFDGLEAVPAATGAAWLKNMTLEEFVAIADNPAANRYTRALGGQVVGSMYSTVPSTSRQVNQWIEQFEAVMFPNISGDVLRLNLSSPGVLQSEATATLNGVDPPVNHIVSLQLERALRRLACDFSVIGFLSANRSVNDLTRDTINFQLQWDIDAFPLPPDSQYLHVGDRKLYANATIERIEKLNWADMQLYAQAEVIFRVRSQRVKPRTTQNSTRLASYSADNVGVARDSTPPVTSTTTSSSDGAGGAILPETLKLDSTATDAPYNSEEFKAESLEYLGYVIPEDAYKNLLMQTQAFVRTHSSSLDQQQVYTNLVNALGTLLHDVPTPQISIILKITAKRAARESGDMLLEELLRAVGQSSLEPSDNRGRPGETSTSGGARPPPRPEPKHPQTPREAHRSSGQSLKERANTLNIDPVIPEGVIKTMCFSCPEARLRVFQLFGLVFVGRINWIELSALVILCIAVPGFLIDEWRTATAGQSDENCKSNNDHVATAEEEEDADHTKGDALFFFGTMTVFVAAAASAWYFWLWNLNDGAAVAYLDSVDPNVDRIPGFVEPQYD